MNYIFDVDGTLTPSRGSMNIEFANWFEHFATHNAVYLVTGSDREKTLEQIPKYIYNLCIRAYQCSGNNVWEQDTEIRRNEWMLTDKQHHWLLDKLHDSGFRPKVGNHIDVRPGLTNFSIVGRGCNLEQRYLYRGWDEHKNERETIAKAYNEKFKDSVATVAGETGIDITPIGGGKEQIIKDFEGPITFYGDKTMEGGNDYTLAQAVAKRGGKVIQVESWEDTFNSLQGKENVV